MCLPRLDKTLTWAIAGFVLIALTPATSIALTPIERDMKKVNRYLGDGFCEDAFKLASDLRASKEGEKSFEVWFALIEAQYCLKDISATVMLVEQVKQSLVLNPEQESKLTSFYRSRVESSFGEVRFSLPPGKEGVVEIQLAAVGELRDKNLSPWYEFERRRLQTGVSVPATLYLPFGVYEIDQVERTIDDHRGISYVVGKERLSRWKRTQIGDGQAVGFGLVSLQGFEGEAFVVEQPDGQQVLADSVRPSFSSTPFIEISSTHSTSLGTMGMVGLRADARIRPPVDFLGGVTVVGENMLIPSLYSVGAAIQLELPALKGINFHAGIAGRLGVISYVRYVAFSDIESSSGEVQTIQIGLDLPAYMFGPEVTLAVGKAIRSGAAGIQIGFELQGGVSVLAPTMRRSAVPVNTDSGSQELTLELKQERPLWGPTVGGMAYIRSPLF